MAILKTNLAKAITRAVAGVLLATLAYFFRPTHAEQQPQSTQQALAALSNQQWKFDTPQQLEYVFRYSSNGWAQIGSSTTEKSNITVSATGHLTLQFERVSNGITQAAFKMEPKISEVSLDSAGGSQSNVETVTGSFTVDTKGNLKTLSTSPHAQPVSNNILRSLLTVWKVVLPEQNTQPWFVTETTAFGETVFSANISELFASTNLALSRFDSLPVAQNQISNTTGPALMLETLVKENTSGLPSPTNAQIRGRVRSLISLENIFPVVTEASIEKNDHIPNQLNASSTTNITLALVSFGATATAPNLLPTTPSQPIQSALNPLAPVTAGPGQNELTYLQETLGDSVASDLLIQIHELEDTPRTPESKKKSTQLYLKLKALALIKPTEIGALTETLRNAPASSLAMELIAGALIAVGTPEAQNAIVALMQSRISEPEVLEALIPPLTLTSPATRNTRQFLKTLTEQSDNPTVRTLAILALGNAARNTRELDPPAASHFEKDAIGALRKSEDPDEKIRWLAALGNAGMNSSLSAIAEAAHSPNPKVRAQAAYSLRFLTQPAALALQETLLNDTQENIRSQALDGILDGKVLKNAAVMEKRFENEPSEGLRLRILQGLWMWRSQDDRVNGIFEKAAKADRSEKVRSYAEGQLAQGKQNSIRE